MENYQPHHPEEQRKRPRHITDERLITWGITSALREDRPIDHRTALMIADQVHDGQESAVSVFASTGELVEGITDELDRMKEGAPVAMESWFDALDEYIETRADPNPLPNWHELRWD